LAVEKLPFVEQFRSGGRNVARYKLISFSGQQITTLASRGAFLVSRRNFDEGLLSKATESGVKTVGERAVAVRRKNGFWQIKTDRRLLFSRILVGADGVNSLVRRQTIGPISRENLAMGYGYFVVGAEQKEAVMKFLAEFPGYIWIFPGRNCSNIGIWSQIMHGSAIKKILDDFISSYCPQVKISSRFAAMFPSATNSDFFSLPCAGKNWFLVGDAAGHVDPISGEGILYALWSGDLAAEAIANDEWGSYDKMWREQYGETLRARCKEKETFYDPIRIALLTVLGNENWGISWQHM
jgi:flavin-dependent dehydrogenase